jgi:biopolymer transport protein ExbD/biopolymer transport protein TolR
MPRIQADHEETGNGRQRRRRVSTSLSEINVVPLVDVMLVLLIIFMVTAPMMQRGIDVNLPVSRRAQPITDERLYVTVPLSFRKDQRVLLGDEAINVNVLHERVRQALLTRTDKDVFLRGDGAIQVQELVSVMDRLKDGGVEHVAIVSDLPKRR